MNSNSVKLVTYGSILGVIGSGIVAFVVLISWLLKIEVTLTILPNLASMKFNTALLFVFLTTYIFFTYIIPKDHVVLNSLIALIIFVAGLTILSYLFGFETPLDEFIVKDPFTDPSQFPGRMSLITASLFLLFGVTLLIDKHNRQLSEMTIIFIHFISLLLLFGYAFDVSALYRLPLFSTVALHTSLLFAILSLATPLLHHEGFVYQLLTGDNPESIASRHLLPLALAIPVFFSWLVLQGFWNDLYSLSFALPLLTVLVVVVQTSMIIGYVRSIRYWYKREQELQTQILNTEMSRIQIAQEQELTQAKEQFLAMFSHDMKTPIATIMVSSDILLNYNEKLNAERRIHHLKKIQYQAHDILNVIDDIMHLTQVQMGEIPYSGKVGDIVQFCKDYFRDYMEMRIVSQHNFVSEFPTGEILLEFDNALLKRMLNNLLGNAEKYSPNGEKITFRLVQREECVDVIISDQGIGIPKGSLETLFDVFSRASNAKGTKGHGLGLAIVQFVVKAHSGTIHVESTLGQGTTFTISLPFNTQPDKLN